MSQHYTYTAADIQRYHSGKMNAEEMHAIEKAALEDPFLADALEGFAYTETPVKDVAELRKKLFEEKKKKNVFFLLSKQNAWLRIAAIFILIAGIGYFTWQFNSTVQKSELANTQQADSIKETASQPVIKPDSLIAEKEGLADTTPVIASNGDLKKENKWPETIAQTTREVKEKPATFLRDQTTQNSISSSLQKDSREVNIVRGRVVDTLGNPVRYATIKSDDKKTFAISDSSGRFTLPANDSTVTATVSFIGYATKEKKLSRNTESLIVMEPNDLNMQEVVVTASGIRRSKKAVGIESALQGKVAGLDVTASQPADGWQKFNEYMQQNIKVPADASGKNYKGTVLLSFETNRKGTPKKIKVVKSLCDECDKEAIRLLTHGPKWKYSKSRQFAPIQF